MAKDHVKKTVIIGNVESNVINENERDLKHKIESDQINEIESSKFSELAKKITISCQPDYTYWMRMAYWSHKQQWYKSEAILVSEDIDITKTHIKINYGQKAYKLEDFMFKSYSIEREERPFRSCSNEREERAFNFYKKLLELNDKLNNSSIEDFKKKCNLLNRAIRVGDVKLLNTPDLENPDAEYFIRPREYLIWLSKEGFSYPQEFDSLVDGNYFTELQPYLNKNHPEYSVELAAAIRVWEAMFVKDEYDPKNYLSLSVQIENWLAHEYGKKLNRGSVKDTSAINRICTLVRPNRVIKGRRPKKIIP